MATLAEIEKLTKSFAESREELSARVRALEDEIHNIKKRHLAGIKRSVGTVAERQHALKTALEDSKDLFMKPKTVIMHGVRVGITKGKGKIEWEDDATVVKLIKKYHADQAEILIKTKETPIRKALEALPAADLKKIGVTVEETGDIAFIKCTDSEVDKFVNALLKNEAEIKEEEDAA
ncbi:MAG TPA: hypothetical protein PK587_04215 [Syntrophales bacterium]|nr:hypothetical protein [Syntrophales bacterium]